jgi:hypothetical protein
MEVEVVEEAEDSNAITMMPNQGKINNKRLRQ